MDDEREMARVREIVIRTLMEHSSPTVDRGDAHGARGQSGYIVWTSSINGIVARIVREISAIAKVPSVTPDTRDAALSTALHALRGARVIFETLPIPGDAGETVRRALAARGQAIEEAVRLLEGL
jgi:hypothetical protein